MPWRPACRCPTVWTGDLRNVYVDQVAYWLHRDNIYFWRFGDLILLRVLPWLDRPEIQSRADVIYNTECQVAQAVSEDLTIDGVHYEAPKSVERLRVEMADNIGPDPRFDAQGRRRIASDTRVALFCPLFRAAILEPPAPAVR